MAAAAQLLHRLADIVGRAHVLDESERKAPFLTDWRGHYHGVALAVIQPQLTAEVAAAVAACVEAGVAVVPQGGNTGLCGGATPVAGTASVVVNLSRLCRIRSVDPANNTLVAEAGCKLATVQAAAAEAGRLFPLSVASEGSCEIGGNISTNAGGVHVLRYGNMRDLVLGIEAVLPDGRVWHGLRALRKDNTGYDLKHLFIGAEGTLGIVTAAVLKLFPPVREAATAWVAVPGAGEAVNLLGLLRDCCGDRVNAFELVSSAALVLVLRHIPGTRAPLPHSGSEWYVLVELADTRQGEPLAGELDEVLARAMEAGLANDAVVATSLAQAHALWVLRESISEAQRIEGTSIKHDISVPVSRIPLFLDEARSALFERWPGARIVAFGHIGDGNLHYNLSQPAAADNSAFIARTPDVNRVIHDLVAAHGGSISAEHGLGQLKRSEILRYKSEIEMDLMRTIKRALDPQGLMNPGKVV